MPTRFAAADNALLNRLTLRPKFVARKDGMEHYVYATGRVTDATFKLFKQVLFDLESEGVVVHVATLCDERVSRDDETLLRRMGVGIIVIRAGATPNELARPRLRRFRCPTSFERIPVGIRPAVRQALAKIVDGDVCVGVLDLAQVLEQRLQTKGINVNTLGAKINEAANQNLLSTLAVNAAKRVNWPRILRAHPCGHAVRRRDIVNRVQEIVDDGLSVLFALGYALSSAVIVPVQTS